MRPLAMWLAIVLLTPLLALRCCNSTARSQDTPPTVQVVENHQTSWRIVSPSLDDAGVPYAIEELRKYVELISGAKLPADDPSWDGPTIVVGVRSDLADDDQAALPPPAKGYDGYATAIRG